MKGTILLLGAAQACDVTVWSDIFHGREARFGDGEYNYWQFVQHMENDANASARTRRGLARSRRPGCRRAVACAFVARLRISFVRRAGEARGAQAWSAPGPTDSTTPRRRRMPIRPVHSVRCWVSPTAGITVAGIGPLQDAHRVPPSCLLRTAWAAFPATPQATLPRTLRPSWVESSRQQPFILGRLCVQDTSP